MLCGMTQGAVILLNGTSSAGKTTLAAQLQADLATHGECWIVIGIDDYLGKLPPDGTTSATTSARTPTTGSRSISTCPAVSGSAASGHVCSRRTEAQSGARRSRAST